MGKPIVKRTPAFGPIEKDVPVAKIRMPNIAPIIYPFEQMEIGDSFLAPYPQKTFSDREKRKHMYNIRSAIERYEQRHDPDFYAVCRTLPEGVRVWRQPMPEHRNKGPRKKKENTEHDA